MRQPSFNAPGTKNPVHCKQHAEAGMVNVKGKRCSHDFCVTRPVYNVEGSKTAVYCKQHASDGMVNVCNRRCLHHTCVKQPVYNAEGSKTPVYCKQHAEDGMVNVCTKRCSYESCMRYPYYNTKGSKTPVFCKKHAEGCMVNVRSRLCSYDSCMRQTSFGVVGSKSPVYCKQHAEDGMVNVSNKRCSHGYCMMQASYNVEGTKAAVYCKQHAEDGMVNVRTRRPLQDRPSATPARGVTPNVATVASNQENQNVLDGSAIIHANSSSDVFDCRKRSSLDLDKTQPPHFLGDGAFEEKEVFRTVGIDDCKEFPRTSSSGALQSHLNNDTVETAAKQTGLSIPWSVLPVTEHRKSGQVIKTEIELAVKF
ncbi:unnamed protein product [Laminaria digitata]